MDITDRMGGFISVKVIETKFIDRYQISGNKVKIDLKPGNAFFEILHKKNGISPTITNSSDKNGNIFTIDLKIDAKNETEIKLISFNRFIAICQNPLGREYVLGTPEYPLTGTKRPIFSADPSGAMGETVSFTGKQTNYPYFLQQ